MNIEKIERYIAEFYKDYSRLRFDKWRYEDGCVLLAAEQLCAATGSSSFRDYMFRFPAKSKATAPRIINSTTFSPGVR